MIFSSLRPAAQPAAIAAANTHARVITVAHIPEHCSRTPLTAR